MEVSKGSLAASFSHETLFSLMLPCYYQQCEARLKLTTWNWWLFSKDPSLTQGFLLVVFAKCYERNSSRKHEIASNTSWFHNKEKFSQGPFEELCYFRIVPWFPKFRCVRLTDLTLCLIVCMNCNCSEMCFKGMDQ